MQLFTFSDQHKLAHALAAHLAAALRRNIAAQGRAACLAVSGGSTPVPLFEQLSKLELPWPQVVVTLADERWVDSSSPDSNEALVRRHLLQQQAAAAVFIGLKNAAAQASGKGEAACNQQLQQLPLPFSAVILGMGNDGHTASLFPGAAQLAKAVDMHSGMFCAAITPQNAPHERMTLTLPTLLAAKEIILHITGQEKKAVLDNALANGPPEAMPIRFILRQHMVPVTVWWAE
jgi:6-phosphogluconolactonase